MTRTASERKASARKAWRTRRKLYGKDGRITKGSKEVSRSIQIRALGGRKMDALAKRRKETKGKRAKKAITRKIATIRAATRLRPVKLAYYKGDQVRPLVNTPAGMRQFAKTVQMDMPRDGSEYESWEKNRRKGRDTVIKEWLHIGKRGRPKKKKLRKVSP